MTATSAPSSPTGTTRRWTTSGADRAGFVDLGHGLRPERLGLPRGVSRALFFADAASCIWMMPTNGHGSLDPAATTWFHQAPALVEIEFGPVAALVRRPVRRGDPPHRLLRHQPAAAGRGHRHPCLGQRAADRDARRRIVRPRGDVLTYAWDTDGDGDLDDGTGSATAVTYGRQAARGAPAGQRCLARPTRPRPRCAWTPRPPDRSSRRPWPGPPSRWVRRSGSRPGRGRRTSATTLPASALTWGVDLPLHDGVAVPPPPDLFSAPGVTSGGFVPPCPTTSTRPRELRLSATWEGETVTAAQRRSLHARRLHAPGRRRHGRRAGAGGRPGSCAAADDCRWGPPSRSRPPPP